MPDPEDYVDAPKDSVRAKLERQRKGASKYNAIPEAVKKDPVGTTELLLAGFGVPEVKSGVESVKGVVATAEKAGDIASKMARFGQIKDPTTQAVQGVTVGKEVLNEAKDAGERKANSKVKPPGASSGALIAQGFDTGAPQQSSSMAAAIEPVITPPPTPLAPGPTPVAPAPLPTFNPQVPSSMGGSGNKVSSAMGHSGSGGATGSLGVVGNKGQPSSTDIDGGYANMVRSWATKNPLPAMKKGGVVVPAKKLSPAQLIYRGHHGGQKEVGARD